jgi:hypothetical protein
MKQKLYLLHMQYDFLLRRMAAASSDKQFEKARGAFLLVKNEIIELETRDGYLHESKL